MTKFTDRIENLVASYNSGNKAAFHEIDKALRPIFYGIACNNNLAYLADDFAQESMIKVEKLIAKHDGRAKFYSFAMASCKNLLIDHTRAAARKKTEALPETYDVASNESNPNDCMATSDLRSKVHAFWNDVSENLNPLHKKMIVLRYGMEDNQEMSPSEIADDMSDELPSKNPHTYVKVNIHRKLKKFKDIAISNPHYQLVELL